MKLKILLLLAFNLSFIAYSQDCGTQSQENMSSISGKMAVDPYFLNTENIICINIQYHIIRNDDGTGGYNVNELDLITNRLNLSTSPHNVYLTKIGHDFIDESDYLYTDENEFNELVEINNYSNAINIYLVPSLVWNGKADGILSNSFVIRNQYAQGFTASHELGHCLNLYHTSQGTQPFTSGCAELPDGSNCETCGDMVCDTPADANSGTSGGIYNPDLYNFMSQYGWDNSTFTPGQFIRIRETFSTSSLLQQVVSDNCSIPEIIGNEFSCNNSTYSITNNLSNVESWEVSQNLTIINNSINTVTVSQNGNSSSNGWIKAFVDGVTVSKFVFVGKPLVITHGIIGGHDNVAINTTSQFNVERTIGNSHYYWTVTPNTSCSNGSGPTIQPTSSNTYNSNSRYAYINWGACSGTFAVACFARNECGDEWIGTKWVTVYDPYDNNENPCLEGPIELKTYPNPVKKGDVLIVSKLAPGNPCDDSPFRRKEVSIITNIVEIYNLQGRLVFYKKFNTNELNLDDLNLKRGIYILNFTSIDGFNEKKRIIIE